MKKLSPTAQRVLDILKYETNQQKIAKEIGISRSAISKHLVKLEKAGYVITPPIWRPMTIAEIQEDKLLHQHDASDLQ